MQLVVKITEKSLCEFRGTALDGNLAQWHHTLFVNPDLLLLPAVLAVLRCLWFLAERLAICNTDLVFIIIIIIIIIIRFKDLSLGKAQS